MKPIKIRGFHKLPIMLKLITLPALLICTAFLTIGIIYRNESLAVIGAVPLVIAVACLTLFSCYGIKISEKRVSIIGQRMFKIYRYEDVSYIKIVFYSSSVEVEIKVKGEKSELFLFDGVSLHPTASFLYGLYTAGLRLSERFVNKSIESLSRCDKVSVKRDVKER